MLKALKPCKAPGGCKGLTKGRYCEAHQHLEKQYDQQRGSAAARGYDHKWRAARDRFLRQPEHMFCEECLRNGKHELATVVDHRIPHKGDERLFWDETNWRPLCTTHHNRVTVLNDGGFGNPLAPKD